MGDGVDDSRKLYLREFFFSDIPEAAVGRTEIGQNKAETQGYRESGKEFSRTDVPVGFKNEKKHFTHCGNAEDQKPFHDQIIIEIFFSYLDDIFKYDSVKPNL